MSVDESISVWIAQLKAGDSVAAQRLWECYFQRLVGLTLRRQPNGLHVPVRHGRGLHRLQSDRDEQDDCQETCGAPHDAGRWHMPTAATKTVKRGLDTKFGDESRWSALVQLPNFVSCPRFTVTLQK